LSSSRKIPYNKPPILHTDQVQLLKSRGLDIPDTAKAEFYLSQLNYYRLAAYLLPFETDHSAHSIRVGTSFDDVLNLYIFDRELRLLLLDAIERIEVSLRAQMAYNLSHKYGSAHPHLNPSIFFDPVVYGGSITTLNRDVQKSKEDFIKHHTRKYQDQLPPIWASVELMTMGQLSRWFANIKERSDRQDISRVYGLDERIMTSYFQHISLVRNHAAHQARLWNRDFTKTLTLPRNGDVDLLSSLQVLPDSDRRLRKLYNSLVITLHLMNVIAPNHEWKARLKYLISKHSIAVEKMGFPADWGSRPLWT